MIAAVSVYGAALWLGLYLVARDPRSPRLVLTGAGLTAYAIAVAFELLAGLSPSGLAFVPELAREYLLLVPGLLWTCVLVQLLGEGSVWRARLARPWVLILWTIVLLGLAFVPNSIANTGPLVLAVSLAPMLVLGGIVGWYSRGRRGREIFGVMAVFTLFFALSAALILLVPLGSGDRTWPTLIVGLDLLMLGLAIAYFDAFELGEALLPDMLRSFDAAAIAALVFSGQVALVISLATGPTVPMVLLLLGTVATAVAATTLAQPLAAAVDRLAFGRLPRVREARSDLRAAAGALARANPQLDPMGLAEDDFSRLTRRALSSFGDLPRLSASPLVNLPLITTRLAARDAPDDPLERAAELKAVLAESIARLKPRTDADFGTSDEWRHYNALHFPYVVGLKPYSTRDKVKPADPASREALEWFRSYVPERTLYNWQTTAAGLVAGDLRDRNGSS